MFARSLVVQFVGSVFVYIQYVYYVRSIFGTQSRCSRYRVEMLITPGKSYQISMYRNKSCRHLVQYM